MKNCFQKAAFAVSDSDCEEPVLTLDDQDQPDPEFWAAVEDAFGSQELSEYDSLDNALVSTEQLTDEDIVAQVHGGPTADQEVDEEEE